MNKPHAFLIKDFLLNGKRGIKKRQVGVYINETEFGDSQPVSYRLSTGTISLEWVI